MLNALKADITKLTSLKSTWVYLILMTGSIFGPAVLMALLNNNENMLFEWADIATGSTILLLVSVIFAAATTAGDIGDRMVAHSFLTQRHRSSWLAAKAIVIVACVELTYWAGIGIGALVMHFPRAGHWVGGSTYNLWVFAATLPAYALMAAGIAVLTRSKLMGAGLLITLCLVIEPLMDLAASKVSFVKTLFQMMPGSRMNDLTTWHMLESMGENPAEQGNFTTPAMSVCVIVVWVLALVASAFVANKVRDTH